jgi:hypothetical protein
MSVLTLAGYTMVFPVVDYSCPSCLVSALSNTADLQCLHFLNQQRQCNTYHSEVELWFDLMPILKALSTNLNYSCSSAVFN